MVQPLLPDDLWAAIAPLIPPDPARPQGGRRRVPARQALLGILFVLRTGLPWEYLPRAIAGCSGMTCWRRLRAWQDAGVWDALHRLMLDRLGRANAIDWSRACLDSASLPAKKGATPSARTRPIGANPAQSVTSWSMATAFPSPA